MDGRALANWLIDDPMLREAEEDLGVGGGVAEARQSLITLTLAR